MRLPNCHTPGWAVRHAVGARWARQFGGVIEASEQLELRVTELNQGCTDGSSVRREGCDAVKLGRVVNTKLKPALFNLTE